MKTISKILVATTLLLSFTSNNTFANDTNGEIIKITKNLPSLPKNSGTHNQSLIVVNQDAHQLEAIYDHYFALKDALVKSDGRSASATAKELVTSLNAVKMEKLTSEEHTVWMKVRNDLIQDATKINKTTEVSNQRSHFTTLSKNMYELIRVSGADVPVYYQHCPMFNNGKGADWLSKEMAIKNPYYGSMMLTCGRTVETIE